MTSEAWAFIDASKRIMVHPFAASESEVWTWALVRATQGSIERAKEVGCRVVRVRIEILEDGE